MNIEKINNDYFIDSDGNIYSRPRRGVCGGLLKPTFNAYGYLWVGMTINNRKAKHLVHRLLAIAFIKNPKKYKFINHKDGNKINNSLKNLEWCSCKQNNQHAWDNGLQKRISASGERYIYVDKQTKRFRVVLPGQIRLGRFTSLQEAKEVKAKGLKQTPPRPKRRN